MKMKRLSHWSYQKLWFISVMFLVWLSVCMGRSQGKGVMRVRISSFQNPMNKDAQGECCINSRRSSTCQNQCRTFFRVCATHSPRPLIVFPEKKLLNDTSLSSLIASRRYGFSGSKVGVLAPPPRALKLRNRGRGQRRTRTRAMRSRSRGINPHVPCTLGLLVTEVVTNSSLDAIREGALDITFPFSTLWPINVKLIIEAWHDVTGQLFKTQEALKIDEHVGKLIMRHVGRHTVEAGDQWSHFSYRPSHTQLNYSVRINCASPYYGKTCSKSCEDLGDKNSHYICDEHGVMRCLAGWNGPKCDIPKCADGCNPVHGFCTQPGECRCALGWRGNGCNECTPLPACQHGYCKNSSFECICEDGWEGLYCSKPLCRDGCHITRGYCERPGECKCRIGWGGPTCQDCKPLPGCINGNCTKPLECRCEPGWTGLFCQTPVCRTNCNTDHGSCNKPGECRCDVGWWGDTCDMCFPYPGCKNGFCRSPWECICERGWKGMLCDKPDDAMGTCSGNPGACLNGGTCIDIPNSVNFTCSCPSLFTGQRCDYLAEYSYEESDTETDILEPKNSPSQIRFITAENISNEGDRNKEMDRPNRFKRPHTELSKAERRALLQSNVRIFFRQPKLVSEEQKQSETPQLKVIERKLLPMPVFLPRVSEIIPGEEGPTRILKSVTKQPTPILVLESRSDTDNVVYKDTVPEERENPGRNQIDENRRVLRHQKGSPAFIPDMEKPTASDQSRNHNSQITRNNRIVRISSLGSQPLQISAHASALPRANPVNPATLRTMAIPNQHTRASNKPSVTSPSPHFVSLTNDQKEAEITSTTSKAMTSFDHTQQFIHAQSRSSVWLPSDSISREDDVIAEGSEEIQTYYEENSNGRVHIGDVVGVDDAVPQEEIYEAFIELKKV